MSKDHGKFRGNISGISITKGTCHRWPICKDSSRKIPVILGLAILLAWMPAIATAGLEAGQEEALRATLAWITAPGS